MVSPPTKCRRSERVAAPASSAAATVRAELAAQPLSVPEQTERHKIHVIALEPPSAWHMCACPLYARMSAIAVHEVIDSDAKNVRNVAFRHKPCQTNSWPPPHGELRTRRSPPAIHHRPPLSRNRATTTKPRLYVHSSGPASNSYALSTGRPGNHRTAARPLDDIHPTT